LLEEYGPKIIDIKGIHNTVADTVLQQHPKSAPSYFLGESIPKSDYQWVLQVLKTFPRKDVGADEIHGICKSLP
jgi:hypothetical protein